MISFRGRRRWLGDSIPFRHHKTVHAPMLISSFLCWFHKLRDQASDHRKGVISFYYSHQSKHFFLQKAHFCIFVVCNVIHILSQLRAYKNFSNRINIEEVTNLLKKNKEVEPYKNLLEFICEAKLLLGYRSD